jgi:cation diffusion facilitator CzcD-associated flavoprotein CzcO
MAATASADTERPAAHRRPRSIRVGIVGAGFGGIGMGVRLKQAGFYDFTIFERGESVGGVWRANTYPGAACDVPAHLYSFSFARGHRWTRRYAPQPEILAYLEEVADDFGLRPHLRFNTEVKRAVFDEDDGTWMVQSADGETHRFDLLVSACGQLSEPAVPNVPGIDAFEGHVFHSAEWDHDHDLAGRRVAVIGTGASAIQFVPEVAPVAAHVDIYQRSAPWILPRSDRHYPDWERRLFRRLPARVGASRLGLFSFFEIATYAFTGKDWVMRPFAALADRYREHELPDPELRKLATPDYEMGCKRVLFTSDWYSTLTRENVDLHDGGVERVTASGVVGADGVEREAETIIWGTGFDGSRFVAPMEVHGRDGRELNDVWQDRPEAYLGTVVSGFPNMFLIWGPNTNHGSGSVPYTLESQFNYVIDAARRVRDEGLRWLDLRPETQAAWREEIAERSAATKWVAGGCTSWYINGEGINTNNWPGPWLEFRRRTRQIEPSEFELAG